LIAALPFANSWRFVFFAFLLFTIAAVTDYIDGRLARSRKEETGPRANPRSARRQAVAHRNVRADVSARVQTSVPYAAWSVGLSEWVVGNRDRRELFMIGFRQYAKRRE